MSKPVSTPDNSLFLFPDPITHVNQVSGACFLYFENPIWLTVPPDVMTSEAWGVQSIIDSKNPEWKTTYYGIVGEWLQQKRGCLATLDLLQPLTERKYCQTTYLSYAANFGAIERVESFIAATGLNLDQASQVVNIPAACSELVRHIHLERYLELGQDTSSLYAYCDELFCQDAWKMLLAKSYFFRPSSFEYFNHLGKSSIILTNERLLDLFSRMPVEQTRPEQARGNLLNVVGWEIFRRLISPRLDPLTPNDISTIVEMRANREGEIKKLKSRCTLMAENLDLSQGFDAIATQMDKLVRTTVAKDVGELLALDQKALRKFLVEIFSDQKTWLACAATVAGLLTGTSPLTAGAAVAGLSNVGAKAFKSAAERREKLEESDFALIYSISNARKKIIV